MISANEIPTSLCLKDLWKEVHFTILESTKIGQIKLSRTLSKYSFEQNDDDVMAVPQSPLLVDMFDYVAAMFAACSCYCVNSCCLPTYLISEHKQ